MSVVTRTMKNPIKRIFLSVNERKMGYPFPGSKHANARLDYCLIPEVAANDPPVHQLCVNASRQCATHMSVHPREDWGRRAISQMANNVIPSSITRSRGGVNGCIDNAFQGTCNILLNKDVGGMWKTAQESFATSFGNTHALKVETSLAEPTGPQSASYVAFRTPP